jgi:hypothetical protein
MLKSSRVARCVSSPHPQALACAHTRRSTAPSNAALIAIAYYGPPQARRSGSDVLGFWGCRCARRRATDGHSNAVREALGPAHHDVHCYMSTENQHVNTIQSTSIGRPERIPTAAITPQYRVAGLLRYFGLSSTTRSRRSARHEHLGRRYQLRSWSYAVERSPPLDGL